MTVHVVQGADGLNRRAFDADDVRRMVEAGILGEDESVELVDGELIEMSPKGPFHDVFKTELATGLIRALDDGFRVAVESTLQLEPTILVEPDILIYRKADWRVSAEGFAGVPGPAILLLIEVANSSLAYDRRRKAAIYARHGLPEYWIVDVARRRTYLHLDPAPAGYRSVVTVAGTDALTPRASALSAWSVRLADLI